MKILQMLFLIVTCAILTGCATSKIEPMKTGSDANEITKIDLIYIKDFDTSKATFKGEHSDIPEKVSANRFRVSQIISVETIRRLIENGYVAQRYSVDASSNTIIVEGDVTLVDSGSGAARFWIGLSAGASAVRANVRIYRANEPNKLIADFQMVGSSGASGGISGGYKDWIEANSKDLGIKLADYIMDKK